MATKEQRDAAIAKASETEAEANWQRESALLRRAEADRDRLADTLLTAHEFIESTGSWVGCHPDERAEVLAEVDAALAALSPVQGEHATQPEGEGQMDDNNLNHLIGERDAEKWADGFLTVVPNADRDLMHTWFACAIESGRMTVHEQATCKRCNGRGWITEYSDVQHGTNAIRRDCPVCPGRLTNEGSGEHHAQPEGESQMGPDGSSGQEEP